VFLCEDAHTGRPVAVKVMAGSLGHDRQAAARFRREAKAAARIDHPAIVPALDAGQDGHQLYMALEFVDGADLYRFVAACGPLDPPAAAHYVARAAEALQAAADQGWVHRDVKPHNLMVDRAGRLRVLDLGLARPSAEDSSLLWMTDPAACDTLLGTADFIAPEQVANSTTVDGRADVYGLGATFYFLLAGRPPLPDGTTAEKLDWLQAHYPVPIREVRPDVPAEMAAVLGRMMAKDPRDRFQAPGEVAAALVSWADSAPPSPDPAGFRDWPPAVRRLLGLPPAGEGGPALSALVTALPSSFPRRTARSTAPARRSLPGWVAVASTAVGLVTAVLIAVRPSSPDPAPAASAAPPSADVFGPVRPISDVAPGSDTHLAPATPDR
jgi:eukaryotic-like serine/threonine-protein kinase